ncbi:hypothetical protein NW768_005885 [Fusarium equiseti]|uniref:Prolyl 4-hydroxylase alpha subunit Fe(2+) 2OG dioxygenase domain-containing protein n=1 Tax=Fusarium equiseti TaxID=61235 RepID=A0ABQ8RD69_FUSEQ|nr:hypothetical protein NW768_005885 [Fusarium equiseti]
MFYPPPAVVEISDDEDEDDDDVLLQALNSIESTGNIATFNHYPAFPNPGLTIGDENLIPLPLKEDDAQIIKAACRQAPFDHGDKTIVDTSIRDTWELDASKFDLKNPEWAKFFDAMLKSTAAGLGLGKVVANPYKLLLYESGSFFKPHKDSEKEKGMIGTLIVCLPSQHEGGDVVLSFGSQVNRFSTAPTSKFDLTSISWFSDVTHEVTKLTAGYRLVLTYKLFVVADACLSASIVLEKTERLKSQLSKWKPRSSHSDRIMYPLDHLYTETSLCLANLKGRDRAVAYSLNKICSEAGFYLMLGHTTHVHTGEDEYGGYDYEEQEDDITLKSLYSPTGHRVASNVTIDADEILGYSIDEESPDSEDEGEFTGNENMAPAFRYHKTVVVLVPKDRLRKYLSRNSRFTHSGPIVENDNLAEMVFQDLYNSKNDPYTRQAATAFIGDLLGSSVKPAAPTVGLISKWALQLNDIALFRTCIRATYAPLGSRPRHINDFPFFVYRRTISEQLASYLRTNYDGQEQVIDWNYWLQDLEQADNIATEFDAFCAAFKSSTEHQPLLGNFKAWADPICDRKLETQSQWTLSDQNYLVGILRSRNANIEWVLQRLYDLARHPNDYWSPCKKFVQFLEESYINGAGQEALGLLEQSCKRFVEERQTWSSVDPQYLKTNFLEPLVMALESYSVPSVPPVQDFFEVALRDVHHRPIKTRPVQLTGWAHEKVVCSSGTNCSACRELNCFLEDPNEREWRFPAEKRWRYHVEAQLRDPVYSLQTLKVRSPHTLVVTKLGTNYDRTLRIWNQGLQQVEHNVSWMRRDYLRCLLGEHKYSELIMLGKPSPENTGARMQGYEHSKQPDAKRMRSS